MNTTKEKIEVMQAFDEGKTIEFKWTEGDEWITLIINNPHWNWDKNNYRIKPEPKKRLMTIKELWGKTLVGKSGALVAVNRVDSAGRIKMINAWNTVEEAHLYDWKLAGPDLDYETATSLEELK
jgi:hypothetical protein